MRLNTLLTLFVCFSIIICCKQKKREAIFFTNQLQLICNIDSTTKSLQPNINKLYITATLINNTTTALQFYNFSCSWKNIFSATNNISIIPDLCFTNWYYIDTLNPFEKRILKLSATYSTTNTGTNFKIGFKHINTFNKKGNFDVIDSFNKMQPNIWSNNLRL